MTAVRRGITVEVSVRITDYAALGRAVADAYGSQQGEFFTGLEEGFASFPASQQLQSVKDWAEQLDRTERRRLAAFVSKLNDYLGHLS